MDHCWRDSAREVSVRQVADAFPGYAYTTLATVLDRLVAKGVLRSRLEGRTKRYRTTGRRGSHTAVLMYDALLADQEPAEALRRFVENLSNSEAEILRNALKSSGRGRDAR